VFAAVTNLAVPTFMSTKAPAWIKVTFAASAATTPTNVPLLKDAVVVPSYTLFATVVPDTVKALAVMSALKPVGWVSA
jgi:hypothetical protein